jgi:hypothetical protein
MSSEKQAVQFEEKEGGELTQLDVTPTNELIENAFGFPWLQKSVYRINQNFKEALERDTKGFMNYIKRKIPGVPSIEETKRIYQEKVDLACNECNRIASEMGDQLDAIQDAITAKCDSILANDLPKDKKPESDTFGDAAKALIARKYQNHTLP